jgi:Spondin_N
MHPSPDWFTGFYLLNTIDDYDRTFWSRIKIQTYPWDAGTDAGQSYTATDSDLDPKIPVQRFTPENSPNGIFVSPDGKSVLPVAEWECVLHVCPNISDCDMENWPPANGCDVLKYPGCDVACDPTNSTTSCQECVPKSGQAGKVYYNDCCQSGFDPVKGNCDNMGSSGSGSGALEVLGLALSMMLSVGLVCYTGC